MVGPESWSIQCFCDFLLSFVAREMVAGFKRAPEYSMAHNPVPTLLTIFSFTLSSAHPYFIFAHSFPSKVHVSGGFEFRILLCSSHSHEPRPFWPLKLKVYILLILAQAHMLLHIKIMVPSPDRDRVPFLIHATVFSHMCRLETWSACRWMRNDWTTEPWYIRSATTINWVCTAIFTLHILHKYHIAVNMHPSDT